jgi:GTPase SAR1 family protein
MLTRERTNRYEWQLDCQQLTRAVFENYVQTVSVDDQVIELSLWDTAGG